MLHTTKAHATQHTTTQVVVQMETCVKNRMMIRSDSFWGRFVRLSDIKNLMTLIGHNTSAKWDAIRSENLKKTDLHLFSIQQHHESQHQLPRPQ